MKFDRMRYKQIVLRFIALINSGFFFLGKDQLFTDLFFVLML